MLMYKQQVQQIMFIDLKYIGFSLMQVVTNTTKNKIKMIWIRPKA